MSEHYESFLAAHDGSLPEFVRDEFSAYLRCGQFEYGFAECECAHCGFTHRVAFSCKKRGFCPSCLGRRMNDLSLHLVDNVLPAVPLRQYVLTVPWALKYRFGYDRKAFSQLIRIFWQELERSYRHRAKRELGLRSVKEAQAGALTFVQRCDSALRLSPHLHNTALDGVYVRGEDGALHFIELPPPSDEDLLQIAERTARRILAYLEDQADFDEFLDSEPLLARCYAASADGRSLLDGRRPTRVLEGKVLPTQEPGSLRVEVAGFGLYAGVTVDADDHERRFQLCRYLTRPPMAQDRLQQRSDGKIILGFKRPWKDGTSAVVLSPHDFIARLCALVPPPRSHGLRYHGCLSAHAAVRPEVVPEPPEAKPPPQLDLAFDIDDEAVPNRRPKRSRKKWAELLARIFKIDTTVCPRCESSSMRIVRFVTDPGEAKRILAQLPRPPPRPPQAQLPLAFL